MGGARLRGLREGAAVRRLRCLLFGHPGWVSYQDKTIGRNVGLSFRDAPSVADPSIYWLCSRCGERRYTEWLPPVFRP